MNLLGEEAWVALTRFGDAAITLPIAATMAIGLASADRRWQGVWALLFPFALAMLLVVASKVAFLGFGYGSSALDFTGASGHAALAACIYPAAARLFSAGRRPGIRHAAMAAACALAALVAVSRVRVGAHSVSESLAGTLLGAGAAIAGIRALSRAHAPAPAVGWLVAPALWLLLAWPLAPLFPSQDLVERLALALAGRVTPFMRMELHRPIFCPTC